MIRLVRTGAVFAQNIFECAVFHPDCSQILTCGSNMKVRRVSPFHPPPTPSNPTWGAHTLAQ
jgi:hypothetical protein